MDAGVVHAIAIGGTMNNDEEKNKSANFTPEKVASRLIMIKMISKSQYFSILNDIYDLSNGVDRPDLADYYGEEYHNTTFFKKVLTLLGER